MLAAGAVAPVDVDARSRRAAVARISRLRRDFEVAMDDDCRVGAAISALRQHLSRLVVHRQRGEIGRRDSERLRRVLFRIDSVLQVLFVKDFCPLPSPPSSVRQRRVLL